MTPIDLRSDTVTRPSQAMLEAMIRAPVGDDVYGEDPSVNRFQQKMAKLFGKEAGLFVPSGVMANQLAIKSWTSPGDEVILESEAHIFHYETAAPAMISNVQLQPVRGRNGVLDPGDVLGVVRPADYYFPRTTLVCLENTHNRAGGTVYPVEAIREMAGRVQQAGIRLHLDGARIWNAHVATGVSLKDITETVDSIAVCFSKGLGAPIGSMLLGPREMIERAHKYRKIFGGGMRQVGLLAAAADFAVENNLQKLASDHEHAKWFAVALADAVPCRIDTARVETNMVMLDFTDTGITAAEAMTRFAGGGLLMGMSGSTVLRAVFHLDVSGDDTERAISIVKERLS